MVLKLPEGAKVGRFDGDAFVFFPGGRLICRDGKWVPDSTGEAFNEGAVMSVTAFNAKFPSLPPLPSFAFHESGSRPVAAKPG